VVLGDGEAGSERRHGTGSVPGGEATQRLAIAGTHPMSGGSRPHIRVDTVDEGFRGGGIPYLQRGTRTQQATFDTRQEATFVVKFLGEADGLGRDGSWRGTCSPPGLSLEKPGQRRPVEPALTHERAAGCAGGRARCGKVVLGERHLAEKEPGLGEIE